MIFSNFHHFGDFFMQKSSFWRRGLELSDPSNHRFLDMPSDPPLSDTWLRHAAGTLNGFEAGRVGWAYQGWDKIGGIGEVLSTTP